MGEGIEKKTNDLAKEVEAQTKAFEEAAAKKAAAAPETDAPAPEAAAEPAQVVYCCFLPAPVTCWHDSDTYLGCVEVAQDILGCSKQAF